MTTLVALGATVVISLGAPRLLGRGGWWIRRPVLAVSLWIAAILGGSSAIVLAVGAWLLPVPMWQRAGCAGCGPAGAFLLGCLGALGIGALVAVVLAQGERLWAAQRSADPGLVVLAATSRLGATGGDGITVSYLDSPEPIAFSSRACGRRIVISTGLADRLTPEELRSVVEHERGHLLACHDGLVLLARLNAACFPRLRGAQDFERRVHLLVELIADDRAARVCGPHVAATALRKLAELTHEESAALRAARLESFGHVRDSLAA